MSQIINTFQFEDKTEVDKIRYLIDPDKKGIVQQHLWGDLMKWFSPLAAINDYQTKEERGFVSPEISYTFFEMVDVVSPK